MCARNLHSLHFSQPAGAMGRARAGVAFLVVALPRVLSQSTGCSHSCCDALDERRSSYGRSSIDGAYEDCTTLALLGHCRTAGHFCDRSCGRCANGREEAEPAWGDVGGWAPGRWAGQQKGAKFPTSKAHISADFHSFWLIFGRAINSRNGLEAWVLFSEHARAEHSR